MIAEEFAVVAVEDDDGVFALTQLIQMVQEPPDLGVDVGDERVVVTEHPTIVCIRERTGWDAKLRSFLVGGFAVERIVAGIG